MELTINKNLIGQKLYCVPFGELLRYASDNVAKLGYMEIMLTSVGSKYITFSKFSDKEVKPSKSSTKYQKHKNYNEKLELNLGFASDSVYLIGEFNKSGILFTDELKCQEYVNKARMVKNIRDNINLYSLQSDLASLNSEQLTKLDEIFSLFNHNQQGE
ncbi:hypothetical protein [Photobacterium damselae]|uniref:hypothetical protein n=1 Tax=Photobacterium damselae TaxID=38293 RepID=UPI004067839A